MLGQAEDIADKVSGAILYWIFFFVRGSVCLLLAAESDRSALFDFH